MKRIVAFSEIAICLAVLVFGFSNCSKVAFKAAVEQASVGDLAAPPGTTAPPVVCDPFDPNNTVVSSKSGLQGSVYSLDSTQPLYSSSTDYVQYGHKVNAELFLNRLFVPTREFTYGFAADNGTALKNELGDTLIEYFGLSLSSKIKLASGDAAGTYELAILSDDGSTLNVANDNGVLKPFISSEGNHSTTMGCSSQVVEMNSSTKREISLTYFQGPRKHIALVMMWRRIPDGITHETSECGKGGNEYFFQFDTTTQTSQPQATYQGLLDKGWQPLKAENFELSTGTNKCSSSN